MTSETNQMSHLYFKILQRKEVRIVKKKLKKPDTYRLQALKKVALYETLLRGSVDENCSSPGSQYQSCKNKCC